jgi:hypothetical protein
MRNILALVGAATVAFLALGWYLGWYQVSSTPNTHGQQSVQVEINPDKITEDVKKGVEKGGQIVDSLRERPATDPKSATPTGPASSFFSPSAAPADPRESSNGWRPIPGGSRGDNSPASPRVPRN